MNCIKCNKETLDVHHGWCFPCDITTTDQVLQIKAAHPDWEYIGSGRHREVWRLPSGNVLKMPRGIEGQCANHREAERRANRVSPERYNSAWKSARFARCRLIPGTSILVMEYVEPHTINYNNLPMWCKYVDGGQVGYNRNNELVAYDFAGG